MTEERLSEAESVRSAQKEPYIIEIVSAVDIPCLENKSKADAYIQAFIGCPNEGQLTLFQYQRIGSVVRTPTRSDCSSAVYNCYRDLNVKPPPSECVLTLEMFHASKDPHKPDVLLGKVDIPLKAFKDEEPVTFPLINFKSGLQGKNPDFAVTVRRAFVNRTPPLYRTFFIIRHGQSKWNRALSRINITGMLDRDHALTTEGIKQAITLNTRWRQELLQDTNYNGMHTADSTSMVPEMFDFSRIDENETLELDEEHSDDDGSDSDNDASAPVTSAMTTGTTSPVPVGSVPKGTGFGKLYDSFFMKRPSVAGAHGADGTTGGPLSSPKQSASEKHLSGDVIDLSGMDVQQLNPDSTHSTHSNLSDVPLSRRTTSTNNANSCNSLAAEHAPPPPPAPALASKPMRRNTYIYSSDEPSPRNSPSAQLDGLASNSLDKSPHQERFSSFDETFPPPEPMVNPFEAEQFAAPISSDPDRRPSVLDIVQSIVPNLIAPVVPAVADATVASIAPFSLLSVEQTEAAAVVTTPQSTPGSAHQSPEHLVVPLTLAHTMDAEALFVSTPYVAALPTITEELTSEDAASRDAVMERFPEVEVPTLETTDSCVFPAHENPFDNFPAQDPAPGHVNPFDIFHPSEYAAPAPEKAGTQPISPVVASATAGASAAAVVNAFDMFHPSEYAEALPMSPVDVVAASATAGAPITATPTASATVDPFAELCTTMDSPQNFATSIIPDSEISEIHDSIVPTTTEPEPAEASQIPIPVLTPVPSEMFGTPQRSKKNDPNYDPFEDFPTSPVGDLLDVDLPCAWANEGQSGKAFEVDFMNRSMNLLNGDSSVWAEAADAEAGENDAAGMAIECSSTQSQEDADEGSEEESQDDDDLPQRREEYIRLFMRADIVYSSPLTRALQTALAAMCGHTALAKNKLTMYRSIREIKRIGGLDTVGIECGPGIMKRVKQELQQSLGANKAEELVDSVAVDYSSAEAPWWTNISSFDNEKDQLERIREFLTFSRYCPHTIPVFVGHSLFFRAFYSKRISKAMARKRPNLSDNMKRFKLSNATLMAVTVKYSDLEGGASDALILDADILFGGGFHGARHVKTHHHDSSEHNTEGLASSLTLSETDIDGSLQLKEPDNIHKLASSIQQSITSTSENLNSAKDAINKGVSIISSSISELF